MSADDTAAAGPPIRDAATVILLDRSAAGGPTVLMGQRGAGAAFMPSKFVFPGGAVDPEDDMPPTGPDLFDSRCRERLMAYPRVGSAVRPDALGVAALRELREETGLVLGPADHPPLIFVFRAITPPGRPRRFDARFFLIDAADVAGDRGHFADGLDELSHLQWVPIAASHALDLPFITEVVLAEIEAMARRAGSAPLVPPPHVPFFDNRDNDPRFLQLS